LNLTVVKIGGSLMGASELSLCLDKIESASKQTNYLIVPGGGKFADSIRQLQKQHRFDDIAAHQMALLAMCQYGYYLKQIKSALIVIRNNEQIKANLDKKSPLLWLPYCLIGDDSEIESSWDMTSDSIALWLATKLDAKKLILIKSKELSNDREQIVKHIENNDLDKAFVKYAERFSGELLFYSKQQYSQL
jgi:aspartokinase-like uncharacterized kinase